jgi:cob(I)alamin adenosyltransferase
MSRHEVKKGLVIVNTGYGKGKTTAALGILLRAWGHQMRIGGIQFLKHEIASFGEIKATRRMGVELTPMGDGFACPELATRFVDTAQKMTPWRSHV